MVGPGVGRHNGEWREEQIYWWVERQGDGYGTCLTAVQVDGQEEMGEYMDDNMDR